MSSEPGHYTTDKPVNVYAIVNSPSKLDQAEIRYAKVNGNTENFMSAQMSILPIPISNTTYAISGTMPLSAANSPGVEYWIYVHNQAGKVSFSDHFTIGVKPSYDSSGKLEFDLKHIDRPEGSIGTPIAYFTNYSDGPLYGTISLFVDGNKTYTSLPQEFGPNQTSVNLEWKTESLQDIVPHHLSVVAEFYGKQLDSDTKTVTTFPSTQSIPITSPIDVDVLKNKTGSVIALPKVLYASYKHDGDENFKVVAPDGTCVIGRLNCLVTNSTNNTEQHKSITIGDQSYRIRYFTGNDSLERFAISSVDPIIGQWHVEIDSDGKPVHTIHTDNVFVGVKYFPEK
jgi:hypothetical protein